MKSIHEKLQNLLVVTLHGQKYTSVELLHAGYCTNTKDLETFFVHNNDDDDDHENHDVPLLSTQTKYDLETDLLSLNTIYGISSDDPDDATAGDWLYLCAYFLVHTSVLFGNLQYQGRNSSGYWPNIHTFVRAVHQQRVTIQQLFSVTTMSYSNVTDALRTKLTTPTIMETEFKVLMNCEKLPITAVDITNFRIVKLLYDQAPLLQNVIEICLHHKFHLVHSDPSFPVFQSVVNKFYSNTDHHKLNDCKQFFHRIYDVFCPLSEAAPKNKNDSDNDDGDTGTEPSHMMLLRKLDELTKVLSWLLPLKYVSYGPKVWQYVVTEMKWCGDEGYAAFNETYQRVYTSLKAYSGTNELFILDNVIPVIQLFSTIGKYKDTCPSVHELLQHFRTNDNDEIHNCLNVPSLERYIYEVDSRIDAIRGILNNDMTTITDDTRSVGRPVDIPMLIVNGVMLSTDENGENTATQQSSLTYGTMKEEKTMRSWLDTQALPLNIGDLFVSLGIRTMDDVRLFSTLGDGEINDTLSTVSKLDRIKLLNAMKQLTAEKKNATLDSSKKRKASVAFLSQYFNF